MRSCGLLSSRWLGRTFSLERSITSTELPVFLCPVVGAKRIGTTSTRRVELSRADTRLYQPRRNIHTLSEGPPSPAEGSYPTKRGISVGKELPLQCFGCGAFAQTSSAEEPGYFDLERKAVRQYLGLLEEAKPVRKDDRIVQDVMKTIDLAELDKLGVNLHSLTGKLSRQAALRTPTATPKPPLCDRCHHLVHHHSGKSIAHPTIEALRETIEESPFRYNHVYHVLDAADFPMSLLPRISQLLSMIPLRTKNRRSHGGKFFQGRKIEMSFVITRSDLLAPLKEQIDSLMPYLKEALRDALGRTGRNVRLGNVRCVSAKRSWWIKELKEEIWERGGGGWMVGRVNVGKSQLFESVFPKGRMDWVPSKHQITVPLKPRSEAPASHLVETLQAMANQDQALAGEQPGDRKLLNELALLPPAQKETNYPEMPVVSSLPGTTASPIRIPFGNGKGELIDLPGLSRGDLELHVKEEERHSLVMKSRITPEQQVLKPGQSLLLGGLIRITPRTPDLVFLTYNFTPITEHVTSTDKAIAIQEQTEDAPSVGNISLPGTGDKIKHTGTYALSYDVTKKRAGPITRRDAINIGVDRLPYRIVALDLLIEGCGWVEIVAQVRTRHLFKAKEEPRPADPEFLETLDLSDESSGRAAPGDGDVSASHEPNWPLVDVYSPDGRFVGSRRPMNAWLLNKPKPEHLASRPRKSMKGVKKEVKRAKRTAEGGKASSESLTGH